MSFVSRARALLDELGGGPVFVHSDPFRAARVVKPSRDRLEFLDSHILSLRNLVGGRGLWMPAFNYDFANTRKFRVADDISQIGPLPERFRVAHADWRTPIPFFSVSGHGTMPLVAWGDITDPFGTESLFARLVADDGVVLYYGETFAYNTIVHYAEREAGGAPYRYDKIFPGLVEMPDGSRIEGSLVYHVRPLGRELEYDWAGLLESALTAGVCRPVKGNAEVLAASARALCDYWIAAMRTDPLALLDAKTRAWVEPALDRLGRPFTITDFETGDVLFAAHD